jgi:hypothetical protein
MSWVFMVLLKKGVSRMVISRLTNLYQDNLSIIAVNNVADKIIKNSRLSLRQGDMFFFAFGIDPLITYLEKKLTGILITSLPQLSPVSEHSRLQTLPFAQKSSKSKVQMSASR